MWAGGGGGESALPVIRCPACGTPVTGGAFRRGVDGMVMEPCGCVFRQLAGGVSVVTPAGTLTEQQLASIAARIDGNTAQIRATFGLAGNAMHYGPRSECQPCGGTAIHVPELAEPVGQVEVAPDPGAIIERDLAAGVCEGCGLAVPPVGADHLCRYCGDLAKLTPPPPPVPAWDWMGAFRIAGTVVVVLAAILSLMITVLTVLATVEVMR